MGPPPELQRVGKSASQVRFESPLVKWGLRDSPRGADAAGADAEIAGADDVEDLDIVIEAEGLDGGEEEEENAGVCCGPPPDKTEGAKDAVISYGKVVTNLGAVALIVVAYLGIGEDPVIPDIHQFVRWGLFVGSVVLGRVVSIQIVRLSIYCLDAYMGSSVSKEGDASSGVAGGGGGGGEVRGSDQGTDDAEDASARVLYFLLALRLPVRVAVWVAITIGCWALFFGEPNLLLRDPKMYPGVDGATYVLVLRILLSVGVFSLLWIVEMWILKSLSVRLYRKTFWDQMRSSIRLEFILRALSTSVPGRVQLFKAREAATPSVPPEKKKPLHRSASESDLGARGVHDSEQPRRLPSAAAGLPAISPLPESTQPATQHEHALSEGTERQGELDPRGGSAGGEGGGRSVGNDPEDDSERGGGSVRGGESRLRRSSSISGEVRRSSSPRAEAGHAAQITQPSPSLTGWQEQLEAIAQQSAVPEIVDIVTGGMSPFPSPSAAPHVAGGGGVAGDGGSRDRDTRKSSEINRQDSLHGDRSETSDELSEEVASVRDAKNSAPVPGGRVVEDIARYIRSHKLTFAEKSIDRADRDTQLSNKKAAIKFAARLFRNVRSRHRRYVVLEDFLDFLPRQLALEAFEVFDTKCIGAVSPSNVRDAVVEIYEARKYLARTLQDAEGVTEQLQAMLNFIMIFVGIILVLVIFEVNVGNMWVTISSVILGLSFIFSDFVRSVFESVILLFFVHPFDVGDYVRLPDTAGELQESHLQVKELGLYTTRFARADGHEIYIPNSSLNRGGIVNVSRSGPLWMNINLVTDMGSLTSKDLQVILDECVLLMRSDPSTFSDPEPGSTILCGFTMTEAPLKTTVSIWYEVAFNGADLGRKFNARSRMYACVNQLIRDCTVEVAYSMASDGSLVNRSDGQRHASMPISMILGHGYKGGKFEATDR